MKTLDEVIRAYECCGNDESDSNCEECSYIGISCCFERENDALHYLKEYRDYRTSDKTVTENDSVSDAENELLTWDELKQMEGKPVWVEYGIGFNQKRWVVIHSFHNTGSFCYMNVSGNYPDTFWQKDMGEDEFWQAYRKERK